jgi:two-component system nitrate/nitrite response regulator NarL
MGPSTAAGQASKKFRILVVDDHELVRGGIVRLIKDRWDVCGEAGNGVEAVEKVRDLKPDLVLLDLGMPLMSGTRAAKMIRAIAPEIKIVFLSMHDSKAVVELVRIACADGFVSKHCNATQLREAIAAFLPAPAA